MKDFEKMLQKSLQDVPQEDRGLENTILLARQQASQNRKRERIPFRRFLCKQITYIGWPLWSFQGLVLLAFDRMLIQLYGERFWDSPASVARLLFCISTLVAMMTLPLLLRSRKYRMQEIETASYFSATRLLMAKLAAIGTGDLLLLLGMFLTAMVRTSMEAGKLTVCLLLPFLILSAAYLFLMGHCSGNGFLVGSVSLGAAMLLLFIGIPGRLLLVFSQGGFILCGILLAFSAAQLRYLLHRSPYGELQVI